MDDAGWFLLGYLSGNRKSGKGGQRGCACCAAAVVVVVLILGAIALNTLLSVDGSAY